MRYIIIGAGVAGSSACETLRERDPEGEVRLFTNEPYPFYTRIRLPELVAGKVSPQRLILTDERWFRQRRIHLHLEEKVIRVHPGPPFSVITQRGPYEADRLLLATGGFSFVPPIPGADMRGVFTLRTMQDALVLGREAMRAKKALLIGGGLLGLEAGNGLRLRGLDVGVVEVYDRLLPRQMDPEGAAVLQKIMERMGFSFQLGVRPQEIQGVRGRARGLLLEDGRFLEADLILISAGVRPHLELAEELGLEIQRGIVVNDEMETSLSGVYAAGDAAEHRGVYYGLWSAAEEQGRIAGVNLAGGGVRYQGTLVSNRLKVAGIDLVSAGEIDAEGKNFSEVESDPDRGIYRKLVYQGGRIIGCILLGDIRGQRQILKAMKHGRDVGQWRGRVLSRPEDLNQE